MKLAKCDVCGAYDAEYNFEVSRFKNYKNEKVAYIGFNLDFCASCAEVFNKYYEIYGKLPIDDRLSRK